MELLEVTSCVGWMALLNAVRLLGKVTIIYWVPTVYRAVNLHDLAEIGVESPFYTRVN